MHTKGSEAYGWLKLWEGSTFSQLIKQMALKNFIETKHTLRVKDYSIHLSEIFIACVKRQNPYYRGLVLILCFALCSLSARFKLLELFSLIPY
jgi:hypothetical protein